MGPHPKRTFPCFEAVVDLRVFLLTVGLIAAVGFAWAGLSLAPVANYSQSGMPAAWLAGAFYFVAALAFVRPWLRSAAPIGWPRWTLVGLSLFGCASTVISPEAHLTHEFQVLFSTLVIALCAVDRKQPLASYLPMVFYLAIVLAVAWPFRGDRAIDGLLVELIAIAFFFIASSPKAFVAEAEAEEARPAPQER